MRISVFDRAQDARIRAAAFDWLSSQVEIHGDVLPRKLLADGFVLDGQRVPLLGPQGIFKPRVLNGAPLSITTSPDGPYDDSFGPDGLLRYRYRGTDPQHGDNRGLRAAMRERLPLVYFHGVITSKYLATWPIFVVADNPTGLSFSVAVDDAQHLGLRPEDSLAFSLAQEDSDSARRVYYTTAVRARLHQRSFRERVLEAYQYQCSFCRLRHAELLDAAHIVPDREPAGDPVVRNGLSLCKLHHAAFDKYFVGLRPDFVVEVRPDILGEHDGPTLLHAIQGLHGSRIALPRRESLRPAKELVEVRYQRFLHAAEKPES